MIIPLPKTQRFYSNIIAAKLVSFDNDVSGVDSPNQMTTCIANVSPQNL